MLFYIEHKLCISVAHCRLSHASYSPVTVVLSNHRLGLHTLEDQRCWIRESSKCRRARDMVYRSDPVLVIHLDAKAECSCDAMECIFRSSSEPASTTGNSQYREQI